MEKISFENVEAKIKQMSEENGWDLTPDPEIYIKHKGQKVKVVHYDGETLEKSKWITVELNDGSTECFESKYAASQKILNRLIKSGLGEQIKKYTFKNYQAEQPFQIDIKNKAINFVKNPIGWFSIMGQPGAGKSHICTAIVVNLAKQGKTLEYMLWMESINKIKYNRKESESVLEHYKNVDVLYIDDFLKTKSGENPSKVEIELAFQILDARYRESKITIISSEKLETEIEEYDRAVYRRIVEMTGTENIIAIQLDNKKDMSLRYKK